MINIEYILFILLIIIILIFINFKNNEKFVTDTNLDAQKYVGPIIFLQESNDGNIADNCIDVNSKYRCIGKYPSDNNDNNNKRYYPNEDELKHTSQPNIIKIPKGKDGYKGDAGTEGTNYAKSWFPIYDHTNPVIIEPPNRTILIKGDSVTFDSTKNTTHEFNMICIDKDDNDDERGYGEKFWNDWGTVATNDGWQIWGAAPEAHDPVIQNKLEPLSNNCINLNIIQTLKTMMDKTY